MQTGVKKALSGISNRRDVFGSLFDSSAQQFYKQILYFSTSHFQNIQKEKKRKTDGSLLVHLAIMTN